MADNISMLEGGDKIGIFNDFFWVDSVKKIKGKIRIKLKTNDPQILESHIDFFSEDNSIFYITRIVDCVIKKKNILYDNEIYQIINEYYETSFKSTNNITRNKIYELKRNHENLDMENLRTIIQEENGRTIFYNYKKISSDDIELNPIDSFENYGKSGTTKIKFRFKEKP